jgi:hypothetical protein
MRIAAVLGCLGACDARLVIQGAGASFPALLYRDAALFYSALPTSEADVIYASMGSGNGKCRIMGWNETCSEDDRVEPLVIDYAGSDSLLKEDEYLAHPDLQMYGCPCCRAHRACPGVVGGIVQRCRSRAFDHRLHLPRLASADPL